jgi:hypothetical protein
MQVLFRSRDREANELRDLAVRRVRFVMRRLNWLVPRATVPAVRCQWSPRRRGQALPDPSADRRPRDSRRHRDGARLAHSTRQRTLPRNPLAAAPLALRSCSARAGATRRCL